VLPKVSIIIITYNQSRLLSVAIDSVLAQTYPTIEVIVVDDGSSDDTPEVMLQYGERVRYIRQENRGVSAARNTGFRASTGEYINFLDSDDFFLPTKIERQMQVFNVRPDAGLVHCGFYQVDEDGNRLNKVTSFPSDHILRELAVDCFLVVHAPLVRREWFDRVGVFEEHLPWQGQYCEDWELWLRMAKAGCQFIYTPEPLVAYRISEGSQMTSVAKMEWGSLGVLDRFFTASNLPDEVVEVKPEAYGLRRLWISFGYYAIGAWNDAQRNISEALVVYPSLLANPALMLQKVMDAALIPRVKDPLAFVDSVLTHLPQEIRELQRYRSYLQGRIMISLAMQFYATGKVDKAWQQMIRAINIHPSLLERLDEFHDTLCHYATSLPLPDPVSYASNVLGNLPAEADHLKQTRHLVLSDVHVACAFRDYEAKQWHSVIRHIISAARHRPVVFKNRGVISIFSKSLLALSYPRRFA
jgi:glycosyltransferase involved in cell wall biosynthesis